MQIEIKPQLLNWAIERSMKDIAKDSVSNVFIRQQYIYPSKIYFRLNND